MPWFWSFSAGRLGSLEYLTVHFQNKSGFIVCGSMSKTLHSIGTCCKKKCSRLLKTKREKMETEKDGSSNDGLGFGNGKWAHYKTGVFKISRRWSASSCFLHSRGSLESLSLESVENGPSWRGPFAKRPLFPRSMHCGSHPTRHPWIHMLQPGTYQRTRLGGCLMVRS